MNTPQTQSNAEHTLRQLEAQARQQAGWRAGRGGPNRGEAEHRFPTNTEGALVIHWGDLPDAETGEIGLGMRFRYVVRYGEYPGKIISRQEALLMLETEAKKEAEAK